MDSLIIGAVIVVVAYFVVRLALHAMLIADEIEKQLSRNLAAVRSMWETTPRASA